MKLKSLLFATLLMGSANSFAAWEKPVFAYEPMNTDGTEQYLFNVDAGGFFSASVGYDYNTRATIVYEAGQKVKVEQTGDGTYAIWNYVPEKKESRKMFADNAQSIWTDNNTGNNCDSWEISQNVGAVANTYTISNSAAGDGVLGMCTVFDGQTGNSRLYLIGADLTKEVEGVTVDIQHDGDCTTWAFVSVAEYEAKIDKWQACFVAEKLEIAIAEAKKLYPDIDLSEQEKVYNDESSTKEQLQAAIDGVTAAKKAAAKKEAEEKGGVNNPIDMTDYIVNPNFDGIKFDGWKGSGWGAGGTTDECAERYNMTFDTYQDIADLPKGVFKVLVNGMYRGDSANTPSLYTVTNETDTATVYLPARDANGSFVSLNTDDKKVAPNEQQVVVDGVTRYVPNTMQDFVGYENNGFYCDNALYAAVGEDGKLRLGVFKKKNTGGDWVIVDSFRLIYIGKAADSYQALMDGFISSLPDYSSVEATISVKDAYKVAMGTYGVASSYEEFTANKDKVLAAEKDIMVNAAAWTAYKEQVNKANEIANDPQYEGVEGIGELADYVQFDAPGIIEALALTTDEINAEIAKVEKMCEEVINNIKPGTDVTNLLKNTKFAQGWEGWTRQAVSGGNVAADTNAQCAEAWNNADFDIYQTVEGAPAGVYEISVQGFYRYLRGNNSWNSYFDENGNRKDVSEVAEYVASAPVYVYLNDAKTPFDDVFRYQVEPGFYTTQVYKDPIDMYEYPDGMTSAGQAFAQGAYTMKALGLISNQGDPLRIGVKGNSSQGGDSWCIFTNFKLVYQGFDAAIVQPELDKAMAALYALNNSKMGSDVRTDATNLMQQAYVARQSGDGKEMVSALGKLFAMQDSVNASIKLFTEMEAKKQELEDKLNESEASEQTIEDAGILCDEVADAINDETFTNAEIKKAIADMDDMIGKLGIPAVDPSADDDNPQDMTSAIIDAAIDGLSVNGNKYGAWSWTKKEGNGPSFNSGNAVEFWAESASNLEFTFTQVVNNLPVGTYGLFVDANNSFNGQASNDQIGRAFLFAQLGEDENTPSVAIEANTDNADAYRNYKVVFNVTAEGTPVTVGVKTVGTMEARWFSLDNFRLEYYGTASSQAQTENNDVKGVTNANAAAPVAIFTANGMQVTEMQKRQLYIVKMSDGSTKKMIK